MFYKTESDKMIADYGINELPTLLVFKSGKLLGHIDGYYSIDDKEVVLSKLNDILKTAN